MESIYKKCVFILICLNFSHLHLIQYTYLDVFPAAPNSFWAHWLWCLSVLLLFVVSLFPHWQNVSLWGLFPTEETKKVAQGEIRWIGRVGQRSHAVFFQKLPNSVGSCARKSPIMKGPTMFKESSKKIHRNPMQPLTTTPARWVPDEYSRWVPRIFI